MDKALINKNRLRSLYANGLSMMDIAKKHHVSLHKSTYWMLKYGIKRRSFNDALYKKYNPNGDPFKIKVPASINEAWLYGLGMGIYWGEGNKADKYSVRVGTSDPEMILIFRCFLEEICGIAKSKFKYSLMCFKDTKTESAKNFWVEKLNLNSDQIGKITSLKPLGKGSYRKISQYGVCTIYVSNIKLKKWIMDQLQLIKYNKTLIMPT